jgi:hypothetical protein
MLGLYAALAGLVTLPPVAFRWPQIERWWHAGDERRLVLERVATIVIPEGETAGAASTGVARFVELALRHGLDGTREPGSASAIPLGNETNDPHESDAARRLLKPVKRELDEAADGDFLKAAPDKQTAAVEQLDARAFAPGNDDHPWHKIKDLILTGYYTSEVGASKELSYELVPGRWDADIPLAPDQRAYSSDWTAVDFG